MKHEVATLEGALLDAAVAKAEGLQWAPHPQGCAVMQDFIGIGGGAYVLWSPSTDWGLGGPLIERESITISVVHDGQAAVRWMALMNRGEETFTRMFNATPLLAAMRAYVASKFGETVEL
jgi:hypothetical protein